MIQLALLLQGCPVEWCNGCTGYDVGYHCDGEAVQVQPMKSNLKAPDTK
jgi:hypothetical protein